MSLSTCYLLLLRRTTITIAFICCCWTTSNRPSSSVKIFIIIIKTVYLFGVDARPAQSWPLLTADISAPLTSVSICVAPCKRRAADYLSWLRPRLLLLLTHLTVARRSGVCTDRWPRRQTLLTWSPNFDWRGGLNSLSVIRVHLLFIVMPAQVNSCPEAVRAGSGVLSRMWTLLSGPATCWKCHPTGSEYLALHHLLFALCECFHGCECIIAADFNANLDSCLSLH